MTISLRHQRPSGGFRTYSYKTVAGARKRAAALVGERPRLDPDGYARGKDGYAVFLLGAEWRDLFPHYANAERASRAQELNEGE